MKKKLSELKIGQSGIISEYCNDCDMVLKFYEMGCNPGENISVEHIAPLGDPISIRVSGYSLSLRISEAENIFVDINN